MVYSSALWSWHLENQLTGHRIVLFKNPVCDRCSDMAGWFFKITSDCLSLSPQEAKPWEEARPPSLLSLFANWTCTKLDIKSSTGFKRLFESFMLLYPSLQRRQWHPLQCSCLENPMDRGAWWAAVHGVAKSRTRLSGFTFTFHFHALEKEMATSPVFLPGESQEWGSLVACRLWGRQSQTQLKRLSSSRSSILHWHHVPFFTLAAF